MLDIIILAAGKGTRMNSSLPKVLHTIAGKPMVQHVLDASLKLETEESQHLMVVGHGGDLVKESIKQECHFITQTEQLGTGHAVQQALPFLSDNGIALILYGDVPLIKTATLQALINSVNQRAMGLLTVELQTPTGYGRILRDSKGQVSAIVEEKDATDEERLITEVNTGIMAVNLSDLKKWLPELSNDNAQGEYYLTDIIALAARDDIAINVVQPTNPEEVEGVNNRQQQALLERYYQKTLANKYMAQGLALADPNRFDCRGTLSIGKDVFIDINVIIEGEVSLGNNVTIGPNCCLKNCNISADTRVHANSIIDTAIVAESCEIGPYARLRPMAELKEGAKVGNFVEIKKSLIGAGSKVNHLSYIGDAELGENVNVGAGTITCNYDGVNKFQTIIGNKSFIGSNSALVAPIILAEGTTIAAGSTITKNTTKDTLAIARSQQRNIDSWVRPKK